MSFNKVLSLVASKRGGLGARLSVVGITGS
jgi:hypothetical protein